MDFTVFVIFLFTLFFSIVMVYKHHTDYNRWVPLFFLFIVLLCSSTLAALCFSVNDDFDIRMEDNLLEDHFYTHDADGTVAAFHDYTQHTGSENYVFIHSETPGVAILGFLFVAIFLCSIFFLFSMSIQLWTGRI